MRIVSKFKDIYDFAFFEKDELPYYERITSKKLIKHKELNTNYKTEFSKKYSGVNIYKQLYSLKKYPHYKKSFNIPESVEHGTVEYATETFVIGRIVLVRRITKLDEKYIQKSDWVKLETHEDFLNSLRKITKEPIVFLEAQHNEIAVIENPRLLDFDTNWLLSVQEIYQEISTYLNKEKNSEIPSRVGSNENAILSHGFDKNSFRTNK